MSRRKDQERFLRLKQRNPDYTGFRGPNTVTARPQAILESVTCSVCRRKRNVSPEALPENRDNYVCSLCQSNEAAPAEPANTP